MRLHIVKAIYRKEALDLVRDRRTLVSMIALPVLILPVMMMLGARVIDLIETKAGNDARSMSVAVRIASPEIMSALAKTDLNITPGMDPRGAVEKKLSIAGVAEDPGSLNIYADNSNPSSFSVADRLRLALSEVKDARVRRSLLAAGIPESVLNPFRIEKVNVAPPRKMAAMVWGSMLGYLLLLLMFSGGMYPIIDMTAGEKERKTLETFLSSPAGRDEIVLGKLLAAMTAIALTAALTLASVVISVRNGGFVLRNQEMRALFQTVPLDPHTIVLIALTLVPLILFAASVMFAIALFARGFKEGQSYLTPLLLFVLFPALLGGLPGLELTPMLALIPIFNASQLIRAILLGEFPAGIFAITFAANLVYAAIALFIAKRRFEDESVLFRS